MRNRLNAKFDAVMDLMGVSDYHPLRKAWEWNSTSLRDVRRWLEQLDEGKQSLAIEAFCRGWMIQLDQTETAMIRQDIRDRNRLIRQQNRENKTEREKQ